MRRTRKTKYRKLRRTYRKQRGGAASKTGKNKENSSMSKKEKPSIFKKANSFMSKMKKPLVAFPPPRSKKLPGGILKEMFFPCGAKEMDAEQIKSLEEYVARAYVEIAIKRLKKAGYDGDTMYKDDAGKKKIQGIAMSLFLNSKDGKKVFDMPGCQPVELDEINEYKLERKNITSRISSFMSKPNILLRSTMTKRRKGGFLPKKLIPLNSSKKNKV